ncbi:MAG: HAMP domain-containing histidine kinase [Candidatus Omnitrophica bacterium]|nr:HAMP domain-containing histidine kinase [Candidatus Omnitrophota bacterium]
MDKAKSNIDRLNRLINDILDLSKMESGKMEMHFSSIDIYKLISEFVEVQKPLAAKKNLFVEVEIEPNLPAILADNDRLLQIFNNLVNNAIKFTDQGGITISVKSAEEKNFIEFMVQDTGRGVKEEDLRKLFEKFQQVGDSTKQVSGTGLGLAICKEIVKLHGGQIWADSKWMEGTAFTFLLPI